MKPIILAALFMTSAAFAEDETTVTPLWLTMTSERFSDLQYSLRKVQYPLSVEALIEQLGLKGHAAWLGVSGSSQEIAGSRQQRWIERFAISDPSPHAGYYELELELHEIVGGDNVNQVVRARLGFVTAEGLEFFADKVCVLEETDRGIAPQ